MSKKPHPVNPFLQVAEFNRLCGNTPAGPRSDLAKLYRNLFAEEVQETADAIVKLDEAVTDVELVSAVTELADGLIDTIYIAAGKLSVMGLSVPELWAEVHRSNMAKVDPTTGKVEKREDGKILKPEGWTPPNLKPIVARQLGYIKRVGKDIDAQIKSSGDAQASTQQADAQDDLIERVYTVQQAAIISSMGESWIRKAIGEGKLRHIKRGGHAVRIPQSALHEFLKAA